MKLKLQLLQVLRGVAASIVVVYHLCATTQTYFKDNFLNIHWGWIGVDLFFVLSGFIITFIHFEDIRNWGSVTSFIKKRVIRIFPVYWILLTLSIFIYLFLMGGVIRSQSRINTHSISGWIYILKNYALFPVPVAIIGVSWSLTFEIIFYFVFALCIGFGMKFLKVILPIWIVLIIILQVSGAINLMNLIASYFFNIAVFEFIFGCFIGYLFKYKSHLLKKSLLVSCSFLVILACFIYYKFLGFELTRNTLASVLLIASAFSLIVLTTVEIEKNRKIKVPYFLVLTGDASYSIYLIHPIFLSMLCKAASIWVNKLQIIDMKYFIFWIIFFLAILAGIVFHLLIEKPLLKKLNSKRGIKVKEVELPTLS